VRTFTSSTVSQDEAIAEADTPLLIIPNQLGLSYNAHVIEAILTTVAPALVMCPRSLFQSLCKFSVDLTTTFRV